MTLFVVRVQVYDKKWHISMFSSTKVFIFLQATILNFSKDQRLKHVHQQSTLLEYIHTSFYEVDGVGTAPTNTCTESNPSNKKVQVYLLHNCVETYFQSLKNCTKVELTVNLVTKKT